MLCLAFLPAHQLYADNIKMETGIREFLEEVSHIWILVSAYHVFRF